MGYTLQDGDRIIIIEDVITAGTAVRETVPLLAGVRPCERAGYVHLCQSVRSGGKRPKDRRNGSQGAIPASRCTPLWMCAISTRICREVGIVRRSAAAHGSVHGAILLCLIEAL